LKPPKETPESVRNALPQIGDQPYWAARVTELGIGAARDGPLATTESLSAALRTALSSEGRARARAVAGTIRTDGATVAARLLLDTCYLPVGRCAVPR
jgi:vancomycin aglycone glucosyltransferase